MKIMKKSLLYLFMLVCSVTLFTGCSDDDDAVVYPIDAEIAGVYKGTLDISLDGTTIGSDIPKNITISKAGDASVNMELKDFNFMGMDLGTIALTDCALEKDGNSYRFTGKQVLNVTQYNLTGDINAQGHISGNKVVVDLDIAAKLGDLEQAVKVVYEGTKLTGSESSEAKIASFIIDDEAVVEQPVINEEAGTIVFAVNEKAASFKFTPIIEISEGATITPASGVEQDFSNNKKVTYTVMAEDGTVKVYTAFVEGTRSVLKYSFEEWGEQADEKNPDNMKWFSPLPLDELATANNGVAYLKRFDFTNQYNLTYGTLEEKEAGYKGSAAKLITQYTKGAGFDMAPAITPGSLFTGKFDFRMVLDPKEQLTLTKFGIAYDKKPLYFKGAYKYEAGENFVDGSDKENVKENTGETDQCGIYAVLYEATDKDGQEVVLDGTSITNSEYRVALAEIKSGVDTEGKWVEFNEEFTYLEGKSYDSSKQYKMAIVCSSSKEGDSFRGAVNSTLFVDELEIVGE